MPLLHTGDSIDRVDVAGVGEHQSGAAQGRGGVGVGIGAAAAEVPVPDLQPGGEVDGIEDAVLAVDIGHAVGEAVDPGGRGGDARPDVEVRARQGLEAPDQLAGDRIDGVDGAVRVIGPPQHQTSAAGVDGIAEGSPRADAGAVGRVAPELEGRLGGTRRLVDGGHRGVQGGPLSYGPEVDRRGPAGWGGDHRRTLDPTLHRCRALGGARRRVEFVEELLVRRDPDVVALHQRAAEDGGGEEHGPDDVARVGIDGVEQPVQTALVDEGLAQRGVVGDGRRVETGGHRGHPLDPERRSVGGGDARVGADALEVSRVVELRPGKGGWSGGPRTCRPDDSGGSENGGDGDGDDRYGAPTSECGFGEHGLPTPSDSSTSLPPAVAPRQGRVCADSAVPASCGLVRTGSTPWAR